MKFNKSLDEANNEALEVLPCKKKKKKNSKNKYVHDTGISGSDGVAIGYESFVEYGKKLKNNGKDKYGN